MNKKLKTEAVDHLFQAILTLKSTEAVSYTHLHSNPNARLVLITNFLAAPEYDELIKELSGR